MEKKRVNKIDEFLRELDDLIARRKRISNRIQIATNPECKEEGIKRLKKKKRKKEERFENSPLARDKRRYAETEKLITQMQSIIYRSLARQ